MPFTNTTVSPGDIITSTWGNTIQNQYDLALADTIYRMFAGMKAGTDGDATISSNTTLTDPVKFYNNLTINAGITLTVTAQVGIIFVKGTLALNGTISAIGRGAAGGNNAGTYYKGGDGGAGGGIVYVIANAITGTGAIRADGANGATPTEISSASEYPGDPGVAGNVFYQAVGAGAGGICISGPIAGGAAGVRLIRDIITSLFFDITAMLDGVGNVGAGGGGQGATYGGNGTSGTFGGSGGGGGGGIRGAGGAAGADDTANDNVNNDGSGGGGGGGGGLAFLFCAGAVPAITVSAKGGNGGNKHTSSAAASGGGGGGGGLAVIVAKSTSATVTVTGGTPGTSIGSFGASSAGGAGQSVFMQLT